MEDIDHKHSEEDQSSCSLRKQLSEGIGKHSISNPHDRESLAKLYRRALIEDALPFWFPRCWDKAHGGFFSCLDRDGTVLDTDKSVWAQGRMSWMLLRCHQDIMPNDMWLQWAESGIQFLKNHCFDKDGRMFFHVSREGKAIRKRRYAYTEAFAAIALAAHANVRKDEESAERAKRLLQHFLKWHFNPPPEATPKHTHHRPLISLGPRMIALITAQELRHQLGPDPAFNSIIDQMLEEIMAGFVKQDLKCVLELAQPDGNISDHLDGRTLNPGHAIEAAWFMMLEGAERGESGLIKTACQMLKWTWERAWDKRDGGLLYFTDIHGKPVQEYWHAMKFWWPHNETMIASTMAYQLTGELAFAKMHASVHNWAFGRFMDPVHGEWYGYLHHNGEVSNSAKGNLWKSCFHYPRALLFCHQWLMKNPKVL
ncbi:MAG: AGE family epimerase/isomerase [Verrucomicrobiota bacterium]|nr:AGE family epimerase/isomerase [Verrucomicrobiota bacterium]